MQLLQTNWDESERETIKVLNLHRVTDICIKLFRQGH